MADYSIGRVRWVYTAGMGGNLHMFWRGRWRWLGPLSLLVLAGSASGDVLNKRPAKPEAPILIESLGGSRLIPTSSSSPTTSHFRYMRTGRTPTDTVR